MVTENGIANRCLWAHSDATRQSRAPSRLKVTSIPSRSAVGLLPDPTPALEARCRLRAGTPISDCDRVHECTCSNAMVSRYQAVQRRPASSFMPFRTSSGPFLGSRPRLGAGFRHPYGLPRKLNCTPWQGCVSHFWAQGPVSGPVFATHTAYPES
jgi:hypothetical protein